MVRVFIYLTVFHWDVFRYYVRCLGNNFFGSHKTQCLPLGNLLLGEENRHVLNNDHSVCGFLFVCLGFFFASKDRYKAVQEQGQGDNLLGWIGLRGDT